MNDTTNVPSPVTDVAYDTDFRAWALDQGHKLREGHIESLDRPNLAEEIESIARREKRELTNCLVALLTGLVRRSRRQSPDCNISSAWTHGSRPN